MGQKKFKVLRRLARQLASGKPEKQYTDKALNPKKPTKRTRFLYGCQRLVYKNLKKKAKEKVIS